MTLHYLFSTTNAFATTLNLLVHHQKLECCLKRLDRCFQGQGQSKSSEFQCLSGQHTFWTAGCVTKVVTVMHHRGPECHAKRLVLQSSWPRSEWGLIHSKMTVSTTSTELLILVQPKLIRWYTDISWSVLWTDRIALVKVKVTVKV